MTDRTCQFSPCRRYRYTLWREFESTSLVPLSRQDQYAMFIGLNPSTADETRDDPTIRRCVDFAKRWGFGALCMTNIFAWRDTKPEDMKRAEDPVGPENDRWLSECAKGAGTIIAAWGKHGSHLGRASAVMAMLPRVRCLRINADGSPQHPLYIPAATQPTIYQPTK